MICDMLPGGWSGCLSLLCASPDGHPVHTALAAPMLLKPAAVGLAGRYCLFVLPPV